MKRSAVSMLFLASLAVGVPQQLVTCISNIANQYFTRGRPLVTSLSSTERGVSNLLQEIHNMLKWPVQIYSSGTNVVNEEFVSSEKHESYIFLINAEKYNDDVIQIMEDQTRNIDGSNSWNSRAKFLVVIYGVLLQVRKELVQKVAEELWKTYKVVEITILISDPISEHNHFHKYDKFKNENGIISNYTFWDENDYKRNVKNVSNDSRSIHNILVGDDYNDKITFQLYTWIPYQSNEICAQVNIFLLDTWVVKEERFEKSQNLYPQKIPNSFHACPIVVSPMEAPPIYVMGINFTDENGKIQLDYTGYEPAHVKAILGFMNFTIVYKHIPMTDYYNTRVETLFDLRNGLMDIAMGSIPLHPVVTSINEPTHVVYGDDIYWLVPCGKPNERMQQVAKIFSLALWCAVISVILICAIAMWQIAKLCKTESSNYKNISNCLINVWALTLNVGVAEQPITFMQRTVFLFLVWYSFAINLVFQTYFTSILVDPGTGHQIHTRQELYSSDLTYEYESGLETYIANAYPEYYEEISLPRKKCKHKETCVVEYYRRGDMVTISSTLFTECFLLLALPSNTDAPHFCTIDEVIATILFPMYLTKGSPLVKPINRMIRLMQESGLKNKIHRDTLAAFRYQKPNVNFEFDDNLLENDEVIEYFVFSVMHLKIAFYVLGVGIALGGLVLSLEIFHLKLYNKTCYKM